MVILTCYLPPLLFESSNFCLMRVDLISQHPLVLCRKLFATIQNGRSFKESIIINLFFKWKKSTIINSSLTNSALKNITITNWYTCTTEYIKENVFRQKGAFLIYRDMKCANNWSCQYDIHIDMYRVSFNWKPTKEKNLAKLFIHAIVFHRYTLYMVLFKHVANM